jgi:tetratricopeptide (TPR) repeat protein
MSGCLRVLGRYEEAQKLWRSVRQSSSDIFLERALVARGLGQHRLARQLLLQVLRTEKESETLQHAWWALGGVERFSGRFPQAEVAFRRAEESARHLRDDSSCAYALCGQGGVLRLLGKGTKSLQKYQAAYGIFKRKKDLFGQAYGLCGMGNALRVKGDPRTTLPLYKKSAQLYGRVGDVGSGAFAEWGLGGSFRRVGDFSKALTHYKKSLKIFRQVGDHRGEVMALVGLGRTLGESNRKKDSRVYLLKARRFALCHQMAYEGALSRLEMARLQNQRLPVDLFKDFGISPLVVSSWKDIP